MLNLAGRKVTVMGLARSGIAAANSLIQLGAEVTVTDSKSGHELGGYIGQLPHQVKLKLGEHPLEIFVNADLIVVSPGIPLNTYPILSARRAGVKVISEFELAYRMTDVPFIAVAGTNGKTTTTSLIGELLKVGGFEIVVGGNIGFPLTQEVLREECKDFCVAEVSSFQLEAVDKFCPHIALLLNISPDHLDRYATYEEYVEAKAQLFVNQTANDYAILNADDPLVMKLGQRSRARRILFSRRQSLPEGVMVEGGKIVAKFGGVSREVCDVDQLGLPGVHNLENALAATSASVICGMSSPMIKKVLKSFTPIEHRLEFVAQINGIDFINDSKGTNEGAVQKSLASFQRPVVLIAGGKDKGGDYAGLLDLIRERVRGVVLIGESKNKFKTALKPVKDKLYEAGSMKEAVRTAYGLAQEGDVVLLSPACASFDMFKNYEERGRVFKQSVRELEEEELGLNG